MQYSIFRIDIGTATTDRVERFRMRTHPQAGRYASSRSPNRRQFRVRTTIAELAGDTLHDPHRGWSEDPQSHDRMSFEQLAKPAVWVGELPALCSRKPGRS
jgi:hypothetical protein